MGRGSTVGKKRRHAAAVQSGSRARRRRRQSYGVRWHDTAFESLASRLVAASTFRLVNAVHVAPSMSRLQRKIRRSL